jgi:hypothetical protein
VEFCKINQCIDYKLEKKAGLLRDRKISPMAFIEKKRKQLISIRKGS